MTSYRIKQTDDIDSFWDQDLQILYEWYKKEEKVLAQSFQGNIMLSEGERAKSFYDNLLQTRQLNFNFLEYDSENGYICLQVFQKNNQDVRFQGKLK